MSKANKRRLSLLLALVIFAINGLTVFASGDQFEITDEIEFEVEPYGDETEDFEAESDEELHDEQEVEDDEAPDQDIEEDSSEENDESDSEGGFFNDGNLNDEDNTITDSDNEESIFGDGSGNGSDTSDSDRNFFWDLEQGVTKDDVPSDSIFAAEPVEEETVSAFDPQPTTIEEVQAAIDTFLESGEKAKWEFEVDASLMPVGYLCEYVEDEETGEGYWTFFAGVQKAAFSGVTATTFAEFKTAVEAGTPVQLGADITATSNIGSTSKYIKSNITIEGNDHTLDMASYQFLLSGSYELKISNLALKTANNSSTRYGTFCLRDGSATSSNYVWETEFDNFSYYGSALLGVYNTDDYAATKRYFNSATFTGDTYFELNNGYNGYNGVIYARNISISDNFVMKDNLLTSNTGADNTTYQNYFKSPGTGGTNSEPNNTNAYGSFRVEDGASVTITRSPGRGTDGATSAYYRSLIFGYADHYFGEGSTFYAKAGTNRTTGVGLEYRSAVIRSNDANSFIVDKNATVTLETDLYNTTSSAASNGYYGFTALYLKKSGNLEILVDEGATLDIVAEGRGAGARALAPVCINGTGSSDTTVKGVLKVYSENGNGWYYAYSTSKVGAANFTVDGGQVNITANNMGKKGAVEYAAFEGYGKYDVSITVKNGGEMDVLSNGYRGMSLAGSGGYNKKDILVTGAGSKLNIYGVHWAIAAETQPLLSITAEDGGQIDLQTTGDVGDGYSNAGSAPSTVYSVGPTTYKVDGSGSKINVYHSGGTYSAIFHDGYGALKIYVTNGARMDVYNKNSGTDTSARRAAITAQSTYQGTYKSYDNEILVDGSYSVLNVTNENPYTHGNGGDTGLYPTGAISFNSSAQGNVTVKNNGELNAISSSLAPTIHVYRGKVSFDNAGYFDIRNNSLKSTTGNNNSYATTGQAIYNERYRNSGNWPTAVEFKNCTVSVWSVLENEYDFNYSVRDNAWGSASFTANNKSVATLSANGVGGDTTLPLNQFSLSSYGRISGVSSPR